MSSELVRFRVPAEWVPKMEEAALAAGFGESVKGRSSGVAAWVKSLVADEIDMIQVDPHVRQSLEAQKNRLKSPPDAEIQELQEAIERGDRGAARKVLAALVEVDPGFAELPVYEVFSSWLEMAEPGFKKTRSAARNAALLHVIWRMNKLAEKG